jgi:hypothetical protein
LDKEREIVFHSPAGVGMLFFHQSVISADRVHQFNVTVLNDTLMKKGDRLRVQVASADPLHDKLTVQVVT